MLDSTVGLLLIYLLLKAVASIVAYFQITALKSGEYGEWGGVALGRGLDVSTCTHTHTHTGEPFKPHYWLGQLVVYMSVMLVMKLMVGPMVAFRFWKKVHHLIPETVPISPRTPLSVLRSTILFYLEMNT